jgi:tRNA pseudouridine38-40 synthase
MQKSAKHFEGEHDFLSFAATDPDLASRDTSGPGPGPNAELAATPKATVRTIFSSGWEQQRTETGELLIYRVRGSGFLHHMVRNLVGTMLDVGRGRLQSDVIPEILTARARAAAGPTAPARGLFLHSVEYGGEK